MKLMTLVVVAGWINQQQEAVMQEDVIDYLRIGEGRGGGLPRAAWGFASLLLPGCSV